MSLADRITRLEELLRPLVRLPVVLDECELFAGRPGPRTILRSRDGARWEQPTGEAFDDFKVRVVAEAARGFRASNGDTAIRLVTLRPQLSQEEWLAKHGIDPMTT